MYKKLDSLLSTDTTVDAWYDDGCIYAGEILEEFREKDWEELLINVLTKSIHWQRKLAYCLDNHYNKYELEILVSFLNSEDEELFVISIDTLRSFEYPENKQKILSNPKMIERVNELIPKSGVAVRKILEDFLVRLHS
jgi:hypothetical protein